MSLAETQPTEEMPTLELEADPRDPNIVHEAGEHPHIPSTEIDFRPALIRLEEEGPVFQAPLDPSIDDLMTMYGNGLSIAERQHVMDERTSAVREQIAQDAERRGFQDLQGLSLTLGNGCRYVVRDTSMQQERRTERKKTGIPHWNFAEDDPNVPLFGREEIDTREHKVSPFTRNWPFLNRDGIIPRWSGGTLGPIGEEGNTHELIRNVEGLDPKFKPKPVVTVEEYDEFGDLVGVKTQKRTTALNRLYILAGKQGVREADWQERETTGETEEIRIGLPPYASRKRLSSEKETLGVPDLSRPIEGAPLVFNLITAQLEDQGIQNWKGLKWDRGSAHGPETSRITQEIISDKAVKEGTTRGRTWVRHFLVRTTHTTAEGTTEHDKVMTDAQLMHYLETGDERLTIRNMRMVRDKSEGEAEDSEQAQKWTEASGSHESISLEEALELMSHRAVYDMWSKNEVEADENMKARIKKIMKAGSPEARKLRQYAGELQQAITDMGMRGFMELVGEMHDTYTTGLHELQLGQSAWDYYNPSVLIRDLMKKRLENRQANETESGGDLWDPLSQSMEARKFRRNLVDMHVGRRFRKFTTKLGNPMPVPTGRVVEETGQPEHKTRQEFEFDEGVFEVLSVVNAAKIKVKKQRDKIWGPIEKQAEKVFKMGTAVPYGEEGVNHFVEEGILEQEERELGRQLLRTVAK